jgi:hypothetical protein
MTPRWTTLPKLLMAAAVTIGVATATAAPAFADDDGWHRGHEWREHEWHEHEWREHQEWHPYRYYGYAPRYPYYSGYYYAPPPAVYVPPPAPSLTVVVPFH